MANYASAPVLTDSTGQEIAEALKDMAPELVTTEQAGLLAANGNIVNGFIGPANSSYNGLMTPEQKEILDDPVNGLVFAETTRSQAASFRNGMPPRGKCIGTSLTNEQIEAIQGRTYAGMWLGDYWTINSVDWVIVDFEPYYNCGDTAFQKGHVAVVPRKVLVTSQAWYNEKDTSVGYVSCDARIVSIRGLTSGSADDVESAAGAQGTVIAAFGDEHVLTYRAIYPSAYTDGVATAWAWVDARVELMSETEVYGCNIWGSSGYEMGIGHRQLSLFRWNPTFANIRASWWLRSVRSATHAAIVISTGIAYSDGAAGKYGVRPLSLIG